MLAEGLDLKGLSLCLFPLIFSYNRSKRIMFESEEALAKCFGYRREYVWKSPVRVTPEAQVPLTLESKFRMTPIKS